MPTQQILPADQHRAVVRLLEAVIRDAEFMADLTAAFLKAQGYRARRRSVGSADALSLETPVVRQAKGFLLNLAAALRLARWERSGLRPHLPGSLTSTAEAFRNLVPPRAEVTDPDEAETIPPLSREVFRTWVERFCRTGQTSIGADVVLKQDSVSESDLLDSLADFLWEHRHLALSEEQQQ